VPAAVTLTGARQCTITHCSFSNLGTWAFELKAGCKDNVFSNNDISSIAAGGFRVSGGNYDEHIFLRTSGNKISYNRIRHFGQVYPSAVGILLQHTEANLVSNNLIHDGYYTGISIGWNWGYQRSVSRDNIIEFNHIYNIGQGLLSDMGAIYTLGVSPGTKIRNNLIHDVDANHYGGWGIYHDEGSSHILVENNIVYNTKFAGFNIHFCKEVTVRNNIFALGRLQQLSRSRVEPHQSVFFEQNIIYWKEGKLLDNNWKDRPYDFYFHPKNDQGTRSISQTFGMDYNLYFNPNRSLSEIDFNGKSWEEWQKAGKDQHSIFEDPKFRDVDNFDFTLYEDSPALKIGFVPIDMSQIGLNGEKVGPEWMIQ
jgi:parallel beta-helix repeat protein